MELKELSYHEVILWCIQERVDFSIEHCKTEEHPDGWDWKSSKNGFFILYLMSSRFGGNVCEVKWENVRDYIQTHKEQGRIYGDKNLDIPGYNNLYFPKVKNSKEDTHG